MNLPALFFRIIRTQDAKSTEQQVPEEEKLLCIAMREAVILHHKPSHIHALSAVLIRLKHLDTQLFRRLEIDLQLVREWAVNNLHISSPSLGKFTGDLDFCYQMIDEPGVFKLHTGVPGRTENDTHKVVVETETGKQRCRESVFVRREMPVDFWSDLRDFFRGMQTPDNVNNTPRTTNTRVLRRLLSTTNVQNCLSDLGYSIVQIETVLEDAENPYSSGSPPTAEESA